MPAIDATSRSARAGEHPRPGRAPALPPEQRRTAIIAAATPLLRSRGNDVTTREIAEAAGIAEGTIFRVFPTKQALLDAVVADAFDLTSTLGRVRDIDPAASLEDKVRACAAVLHDRLTSVIELMIALRMMRPTHESPRGAAPWPSRSAPEHRHRHSEVLDAVAELFAPDAELLSCTPQRAAHLLRLLTFAGSHRLINEQDPLEPDEIANVLLHGIVGDRHGIPPPPQTVTPRPVPR